MLLGAYEVLLCVARGGMANVWAAQHRDGARLVALKTALPELCEPEFEAMFHYEARVASRIRHPNVCEIFELIEQGAVLALCMEWVDGCTLSAIIGDGANAREQQPMLDLRVAAHIVAETACGLHAAHELRDEAGAPMNLVHRDVSPQNILISRSGQVKVADFGVAKASGIEREATAVGRIKGKIGYMSPEQAQGKVLDRRSDIFALGVVLYLATVGLHPFRRAGDSRDQQYLRLLVGELSEPSAIVRDYPRELESIVLCALAAEPAERFASAEELRRALVGWLQRTGPVVTEQHVARVVEARAGRLLDERSQRIRICQRASRFGGARAERQRVSSDDTFLPTISPAAPDSAMFRTRRAPRARTLLTALAAAGVGMLAGPLLSTRSADPSPSPAAAAAAMPSVPGPLPLEPLETSSDKVADRNKPPRALERTPRAQSVQPRLAAPRPTRTDGAPARGSATKKEQPDSITRASRVQRGQAPSKKR